jgi:hypothetical protein
VSHKRDKLTRLDSLPETSHKSGHLGRRNTLSATLNRSRAANRDEQRTTRRTPARSRSDRTRRARAHRERQAPRIAQPAKLRERTEGDSPSRSTANSRRRSRRHNRSRTNSRERRKNERERSHERHPTKKTPNPDAGREPKRNPRGRPAGRKPDAHEDTAGKQGGTPPKKEGVTQTHTTNRQTKSLTNVQPKPNFSKTIPPIPVQPPYPPGFFRPIKVKSLDLKNYFYFSGQYCIVPY